MKVKRIKLENFKCFESVEIECAKITLLTGANSSGKSSLLNGLLGAYQTTRFPFFYSPNGDYVNMGDYSEVAFNHARKGDFRIALEFEQSSGSSVFDARFSENSKTRQPKLKSLTFVSPQFKMSLSHMNSHHEGEYSYTPTLDKEAESFKKMQSIFTRFIGELEEFARKVETKDKNSKRLTPSDFMKLWYEPSEGKLKLSAGFEINAQDAREAVVDLQISNMTSMVSGMNQQFNYISSFRNPPDRTYYRKTKGTLKVGKYGENHIDQLVEWEQSRSKEFRTLVKSLQQLTLLDEIHTQTFRGGRFDIKVKPSRASVDTSLIDVGFGVSQLLPIIVADLQLDKGATVAISQPEIHLHPSAQSLLGEYFLKNAIDKEKCYIVETHSEYLVNKCRALIAKGDLKPEDVKTYYLRKSSDRSECFPITFTRDGKIEGAPKDFFDTYMCDVMQIALNA